MWEFVVICLFVWRISSLLVDESGPWDILVKFRRFIGVYYDEYSMKQAKTPIASLFLCVWCISVWLGWLVAIPWVLSEYGSLDWTSLGMVFFCGLAISAGVIVVDGLANIAGDR